MVWASKKPIAQVLGHLAESGLQGHLLGLALWLWPLKTGYSWMVTCLTQGTVRISPSGFQDSGCLNPDRCT